MLFHLGTIKLTLATHLSNIKLWAACGVVQLASIQPAINDFITKYIFSDFTFLKYLAIAVVIDLITGIAKAWAKKEAVTSKGLRDTIVKFIQYGSFLIITHVLSSFEVNGQPVSNMAWISKLAYEFIMLIEIKSVYENIVAINPKLDLFEKVFKKIADAIKDDKKKQ